MGLLSTLRVKLIADIDEYAKNMALARTHAGQLQTGLGAIGDGMERVGSKLGQIATIAAGQLLATGIIGIGNAVAAAGREAFTAVADYERLSASITALTAKEILNGSVVKESIATGTYRLGLTQEEIDKKEKLVIKIRELNTDIQVGEERLAKATATGKQSAAELENRQQAIDALRRRQVEATTQLGALDAKSNLLVTTYKNVSRETLTMAEAQLQATGRVKEILAWIQKLAIESPYTRETVANTYRQALAFGFTSDEAQTLTQSVVDFASATGATPLQMDRIALALGQVKAKGRLMSEELRQMAEAGIATNDILATMGVTSEEVTRRFVDGAPFIAAFNKNIAKNFAGAAKAQSKTFSGLVSSFQDLKDVLLRVVFTPLFTAFKPILDSLVDSLQKAEVQKIFADIGNALSKPLSALMLFRVLVEQGIEPLSALRTVITTSLGPEATQIFDNIVEAVQKAFAFLQENWPTIRPILVGIGAAFATIAAIMIASDIYGLIVAIGAVLSTISLPVVAIVAAIGLLAAAWDSDFQGIRTSLTQVWEGTLRPALEQLWGWLQVNIPIAVQALADFWTSKLQPALETVGIFISTQIVPILSDIAMWLATNIPIAISAMVTFWNDTLMPTLAAGWDWLNVNLFPTLESLGNLIGVVISKTIETMAWSWRNVLQPALERVWKFLTEDMQPVWKALQSIFETISPIIQGFLDGAWKNFQKSLEFVGDLLREAKKLFDGLSQALQNFKLPPELQRHSPSPLEQTFMGVRDTLKDINLLGMPDFSSIGLPNMGMMEFGAAGAAPREINMTINVGGMADGLDMYDAARAIGREVARRL